MATYLSLSLQVVRFHELRTRPLLESLSLYCCCENSAGTDRKRGASKPTGKEPRAKVALLGVVVRCIRPLSHLPRNRECMTHQQQKLSGERKRKRMTKTERQRKGSTSREKKEENEKWRERERHRTKMEVGETETARRMEAHRDRHGETESQTRETN